MSTVNLVINITDIEDTLTLQANEVVTEVNGVKP